MAADLPGAAAESVASECNQSGSESFEQGVGRTTARDGLRVWGTDVTGRTVDSFTGGCRTRNEQVTCFRTSFWPLVPERDCLLVNDWRGEREKYSQEYRHRPMDRHKDSSRRDSGEMSSVLNARQPENFCAPLSMLAAKRGQIVLPQSSPWELVGQSSDRFAATLNPITSCSWLIFRTIREERALSPQTVRTDPDCSGRAEFVDRPGRDGATHI